MCRYNLDLNQISPEKSQGKLLANVKIGNRVLELGPASGYMTRYMKDKLNCKITAVELDPKMGIKIQGDCEKVIIADLDGQEWVADLAEESFDVTICGDVLEHLRNPVSTLNTVKPLLKKDGILLVSVPNIAHNSIIMELLKGNFDYQETGLLDGTHIHFFSRSSIKRCLNDAGFSIVKWDAVNVPPRAAEFESDYSDFSFAIQRDLLSRPDAHVYQFILIAKKTEVVFGRVYPSTFFNL